MKTNIVIGRFQAPRLTKGHIHLIQSSLQKRPNATLVFFVGTAPLSYTDKNPLPPEAIVKMLKTYYPNSIVKIIYDTPKDEDWSENIDREVSRYKNPVLFGSRDSFIPKYHGKYKCVEIKQLPSISATNIRKSLKDKIYSTSHFRAGVIHAVENRFPTAYPTVDIAVIRLLGTNYIPRRGVIYNDIHFGKRQILLGRKPGRTKYCFIGGFVDPTDSCLEVAAGRELSEEVPGIITHEFKYIGSRKVNDFRYKGTKDGIMTSLFVTYMMGGSVKAGDDLKEVKWFDIANFDMSVLTEYHHPLFEMLKKHLKL